MTKIGVMFLAFLLLTGGAFWAFNNDSGINDGIENAGKTFNNKMTKIDYDGTKAPGGTTQDTKWISTSATNE